MDIKISTGFRDDQYVIIDSEEAHKAYYLFTHPEERAIFSNGVALIGRNIQEINPAWNEIMGWNPTHRLDDDDWNDIRGKGTDVRVRNLLATAKEVSYLIENNPYLIEKTVSEAKLLIEEKKLIGKNEERQSENQPVSIEDVLKKTPIDISKFKPDFLKEEEKIEENTP